MTRAYYSIINAQQWSTWKLLDGQTMAGTLVSDGTDSLLLRRVDGTICLVRKDQCHPATCDDILVACDFYAVLPRA